MYSIVIVVNTANTAENKTKFFVCLFKQNKRAVLHQTHYVELLVVVDNERVSHVNLIKSSLFSLSDGYVTLREMSDSSS